MNKAKGFGRFDSIDSLNQGNIGKKHKGSKKKRALKQQSRKRRQTYKNKSYTTFVNQIIFKDDLEQAHKELKK